jgi:hypothetical protein
MCANALAVPLDVLQAPRAWSGVHAKGEEADLPGRRLLEPTERRSMAGGPLPQKAHADPKEKGLALAKPLILLVARGGIEPSTRGFSKKVTSIQGR